MRSVLSDLETFRFLTDGSKSDSPQNISSGQKSQSLSQLRGKELPSPIRFSKKDLLDSSQIEVGSPQDYVSLKWGNLGMGAAPLAATHRESVAEGHLNRRSGRAASISRSAHPGFARTKDLRIAAAYYFFELRDLRANS